MTSPEAGTIRVSHRDHPLRRIQSLFEGRTKDFIHQMHARGLLANTRIDDVLSAHKELHADDVTLSNLQMTVDSADRILSEGPTRQNVTRALVGWSLDGLDGALARFNGESSPEGSVKDAVLDRLGEMYIARSIGQVLSQAIGSSYEPAIELMSAIQLSTLTKAACEMYGVRTSEGGMGSMIERRLVLIKTLINTAKVYRSTSDEEKSNLIAVIDQDLEQLIGKSNFRARERAKHTKQWDNPELSNHTSPAASEARKYVTLILVNRGLRIDLLLRLDSLVTGRKYPSPEELLTKYPYIEESFRTTRPFIAKALAEAKLYG